MGITSIGKTVTTVTQNIIKVIEEGCDIATHPHTQADVDKFWRDLANVGKDASKDLSNEAQAQAREAAVKRLTGSGWSKADAEKWFENQWKKIADSAEKASKTVPKVIPKVEKAAHSAWLKLAGFVGAAAAIVSVAAIISAINSGPTPEQQRLDDFFRRQQVHRMQMEQLEKIAVSEEEFNLMVGSLAVPSPPEVEAPETPLPVLPPPIAAIAYEPAKVEVTTSSGTRGISTTVGQVYRSSPPQVQQAMERPSHTEREHSYEDHPSRLGHKDFTVDAGFASAHISF